MNLYLARYHGCEYFQNILSRLNNSDSILRKSIPELEISFHHEGKYYQSEWLEDADTCIMLLPNTKSFGKGLFEQIMTCKHLKKPLFVIVNYTTLSGQPYLYVLDGLEMGIEKLRGEDYKNWGKVTNWGSYSKKFLYKANSNSEGLKSIIDAISYRLIEGYHLKERLKGRDGKITEDKQSKNWKMFPGVIGYLQTNGSLLKSRINEIIREINLELDIPKNIVTYSSTIDNYYNPHVNGTLEFIHITFHFDKTTNKVGVSCYIQEEDRYILIGISVGLESLKSLIEEAVDCIKQAWTKHDNTISDKSMEYNLNAFPVNTLQQRLSFIKALLGRRRRK